MSDLDDIRRRVRDAADRAASVAAEDLLGRSQRDAPVEEGTLRGSGRVERVEDDTGVQYEVSFNTVYAAAQHEHTEYRHPRGGKAKYLEHNLQAMAGRYERVIGEAIQQELERP